MAVPVDVVVRDRFGPVRPSAELFIYERGTETEVDVWADAAKTIPLTQPLVANREGAYPSAWVDHGSYDRVLVGDDENPRQAFEAVSGAGSALSPDDNIDFTGDVAFTGEVDLTDATVIGMAIGGMPWVNVADHGVLPSASAATNDAGIIAAIDALPVVGASKKGIVFFGAGAYDHTPISGGKFWVGDGVKIMGESWSSTSIKATTGAGSSRIFEVSDGRVEFQDITLQGPDTFTVDDDVSGIGFENEADIYLYCKNVRFFRLNVGARGYGGVSQTMEFDNCVIDGDNIGLDGGPDEQHSVYGVLTFHTGGGVIARNTVFKNGGSNTVDGSNLSHQMYLGEETPLDLQGCKFYRHIDGRYIQVYGSVGGGPPAYWNIDDGYFGPEQVPNIGVQTSPQVRAIISNTTFDCDRVSLNPRGPCLLTGCNLRGGIANAWYTIDLSDPGVVLDIDGGTEFSGSVGNDIFIQADDCELNVGRAFFRHSVNDTHIAVNSGVTGTKIRVSAAALFDMDTAVTAIGLGGGGSTCAVLKAQGATFTGDYRAIFIASGCTVTDLNLQANDFDPDLTPLTNSGTATTYVAKANIGLADVP